MKRDSLVLVVALMCGLAAFSLIFNFLKQAAAPKGQYVLARADIAQGKVIAAEDLMLSDLIANPGGQHFTQMYEVIGMEAVQALPVGHLMTPQDLKKPVIVAASPTVKPEEVEEVLLPVPKGLRSLTLGTQELENIPSSLKGGDYVDILGNIVFGNNQNEVRTILRGVMILGVQKTMDKKQIQSLSFALFPAQVETVLNASKFGRLRLVITQQPADNTTWTDMGSIEVIRGIQREKKIT